MSLKVERGDTGEGETLTNRFEVVIKSYEKGITNRDILWKIACLSSVKYLRNGHKHDCYVS